MKKRPIVLTIFAFMYFLYPVYYTAQVLYFHHIPLKHLLPLLKILFNPFQQFNFFFLTVSAFILGYGLFKVRAWAYWFFIFHAFYTISLNIHNFFKYGDNDLIPPTIRFSTITVTFLIIFYLIRKHIRAPYFNPRLRWWENSPRFRVEDMKVKLKRINEQSIPLDGEIYDMSEGGVFVVSDLETKLGEKFNIIFQLFGEVTIDCLGKIVWISDGKSTKHPRGFGILFTEILKNDKRQINFYLKSLSKDLER